MNLLILPINAFESFHVYFYLNKIHTASMTSSTIGGGAAYDFIYTKALVSIYSTWFSLTLATLESFST